MDADQVVALYGQRWGVEDFIEQMTNQYHLGRFPDTEMKIVKVHIALTFLLYQWVRGFAQLAAEWLAQPQYGRMEICRFGQSNTVFPDRSHGSLGDRAGWGQRWPGGHPVSGSDAPRRWPLGRCACVQ